MKNTKLQKILVIVHWVITIGLIIVVTWLVFSVKMLIHENEFLHAFYRENAYKHNNLVECINHGDTECEDNKYVDSEQFSKELDEILSSYPNGQ